MCRCADVHPRPSLVHVPPRMPGSNLPLPAWWLPLFEACLQFNCLTECIVAAIMTRRPKYGVRRMDEVPTANTRGWSTRTRSNEPGPGGLAAAAPLPSLLLTSRASIKCSPVGAVITWALAIFNHQRSSGYSYAISSPIFANLTSDLDSLVCGRAQFPLIGYNLQV